MGRLRVSIALLICFHCWTAERPEPAPDSTPELHVNVAVYNRVDLPSDQLMRAEREAARIFQYAGIQLKWVSGLLGSGVNKSIQRETWNPLMLQLRIWPRAAAGKQLPSTDTWGFCLSWENGDAVVLGDAIEKHVIAGIDSADLLGLAMAHELGHLLLRSSTHSVTGIMRAQFTQMMLRDDARGFIRFNPGEAEFIRKEVSRRIALNRR